MDKFTALDETIGTSYSVRIEHDHDYGAPWDNEDGHGPVSDWTTRAKRPGEMVLSESYGKKRFYNFAEACRIARRDRWGALPEKYRIEYGANGLMRLSVNHFIERRCETIRTIWHDDINAAVRELYDAFAATFPSDRAYRAFAAKRDYERLKAWCDDKWHYVGVIVTDSDGNRESLWGLESDNESYLLELANELLAQIMGD